MRYILSFLLAVVFASPVHAQTYPTDTIATTANAEQLRDLLEHEAFGDCGFPTGEAMVTGSGSYNGWPYQALSSGGKLFDRGSNRLLIFHGGHDQEATAIDVGGPLVQYAISVGWDVMTINMPPGDHSQFASHPYPLTNFLTPVALSVNYALDAKAYDQVVMAGLSGGGWTTVVYAALDTRIKKSFPVAGSWPEYLRHMPGNENSIGDYEQQLPGLSLSYLDLYALALTGNREQLQVFNSSDPCCFGGYAPLSTYLDEMQAAATSLGGTFGITVVTNSTHTVHPSVFDEIAGSPPPAVPVTARYELDETSGSQLVEANGRFNGAYYNAPNLGLPGMIATGTSVAFDGASQYATVPDHPDLRPGVKEYAIEFWAKYDSTGYGMAFGKFEMYSPYAGPIVFFNMLGETPTAGRVQLRDKKQYGYWVDSTSTGLNDNVPRYYVFQRRQVSPNVWDLQIYINGILDAETTLPSVEDLQAANQMYLMSRPEAAQYVGGTFDRFQYHVGKSFSPAEVLSNYNSQLP